MPDTGSQKPWMRTVWPSRAWQYWDNLKLTPFAGKVGRACRMDFVRMMQLRLRWMIRRPRRRGIFSTKSTRVQCWR
jgi:hypothetical protein